MLNIKKIIKLVLIATFVCVMGRGEVWAAEAIKMAPGAGGQGCSVKRSCPPDKLREHLNQCCHQTRDECIPMVYKCVGEGCSVQGGQCGKWGNGVSTEVNAVKICNPACKSDEDCIGDITTKTMKCIKKSTGSNTQQDAGAVTGCSGNLGLFSGLVNAGREIFEGLRDLIYVVAGFGIIGVAVGGFFGNLNWKWLGAIVISLVIIATTGELITAITGCEGYTSAVIQDTLK